MGPEQESHWNPMGTRPTGILVAPVEPHWNQTSFLAMGPTGVLLESDMGCFLLKPVGALRNGNPLETPLGCNRGTFLWERCGTRVGVLYGSPVGVIRLLIGNQ